MATPEFDEGARVALGTARALARVTGSEFASASHLLLGILADEHGEGVLVLASLGVSLAQVRLGLEGALGNGEPRPERVEEFLPHARRAIDLACMEASDAGAPSVTSAHLLLGLLCEGESDAARMLTRLGVRLKDARFVRNVLRLSTVEQSAMWQRFTERARKVVFYAQEEAQKFGEGYVSTEHLLLGLIRETDNLAARVLEALGISCDRVRVEVEKYLPRGATKPSQDMTLTPRAKRIIDLAYDEARGLNNNYIGTEHLLLGLLREGEGLAGRVLIKLGLEIEQTREIVRELQAQEPSRGGDPAVKPAAAPPPADPWARFEDAARRTFVVAETEALQRGQSYRSPEHLLLALLSDRENVACRALAGLEIDLDALREATEERCRTAPPREGEAPLSPAATQAFSLAYKEQAMMDAERTGTEHLLLGLLREPDGMAGRVLEQFGVNLASLREAIRTLPS